MMTDMSCRARARGSGLVGHGKENCDALETGVAFVGVLGVFRMSFASRIIAVRSKPSKELVVGRRS